MNCNDFIDFSNIQLDLNPKTKSEDNKDKNESSYNYKRRDHFRECINRMCEDHTDEIPDSVMYQIEDKLYGGGYFDTKLTKQTIKLVLHDLKYQKYYEYVNFIFYRLAGLEPPKIDEELKEKLIKMFDDIQEPFEKFRPKERTSFISYNFVLHKFFQLLKLPSYCDFYCKPIVSQEKVQFLEEIWEKICSEVSWEYIK